MQSDLRGWMLLSGSIMMSTCIVLFVLGDGIIHLRESRALATIALGLLGFGLVFWSLLGKAIRNELAAGREPGEQMRRTQIR